MSIAGSRFSEKFVALLGAVLALEHLGGHFPELLNLFFGNVQKPEPHGTVLAGIAPDNLCRYGES
jgi:hypothetical protein